MVMNEIGLLDSESESQPTRELLDPSGDDNFIENNDSEVVDKFK